MPEPAVGVALAADPAAEFAAFDLEDDVLELARDHFR